MKYFIRSLKYFAWLCVLCVALMALMLVTGNSALTLEQTVQTALYSDRYLPLLGAILVLAALYPKFGFVTRSVEGDVVKNREQIINAFLTSGFTLRREEQGVMIFRAEGALQRFMNLGEDEIKVSQQGSAIRIEGIRRVVARICYRLDSYIQMTRND